MIEDGPEFHCGHSTCFLEDNDLGRVVEWMPSLSPLAIQGWSSVHISKPQDLTRLLVQSLSGYSLLPACGQVGHGYFSLHIQSLNLGDVKGSVGMFAQACWL